MKDILAFSIGFMVCGFNIWLFGFDFNNRGTDAGFSFIFCILFGWMSYLLYNFRKLNK